MTTKNSMSLSAKLLAVFIVIIVVFGSIAIVIYVYNPFKTYVEPPLNTPSSTSNVPPSFNTPTLSPSTPTMPPYTDPPITPSPTPNAPISSPPPPSSVTPTPYQSSTPTPTLTASPTPSPTPVTSLSNAISQGLVQATFSGDGNCAGDCITLKITRIATHIVEIEPPAVGTLLTTSSGTTQTMVLYQLKGIQISGTSYTVTTRIVLTDSTPVTYVFRAYCLDFHKSNPQTYDQFTQSGTASADVVKILNTLSSLTSSATSNAAVQTAIWVVTDNVSQQELSSTFPSGVSEISNARAILAAAGIDTSGKALFAPT